MDANAREKSLSYSLRDGMAWSVMVGFGEQYIGAFAVLLSATKMQMGILSSLPSSLGAFSQILSARITDKIGERRKIIVPAAALQGLLWIPILLAPRLVPASVNVPVIICLVTLLTICGHFIGPPWISLMGDLVRPAGRGIYFASRHRLCHIFTIVSVGLAGAILHFFKSLGPDSHLYGFFVIFTVACLARLVSAAYLWMQYEPAYQAPTAQEQFGYLEFIRGSRNPNFARFSYFTAAMNFSIQLAAPLFVVYLLRDLNMSYIQFTSILCLIVLSQILTLVYWGRAADRFGNKIVILWSGLGLCAMPMLLSVSTHFAYIAVLKVLWGAFGAGFGLCATNYMYDAVPPPERAQAAACYNVTNALGVLAGGFAGGWMSGILPADFGIGSFQFHLASNILTLSLISGLFCFATLGLFRNTFQDLRPAK